MNHEKRKGAIRALRSFDSCAAVGVRATANTRKSNFIFDSELDSRWLNANEFQETQRLRAVRSTTRIDDAGVPVVVEGISSRRSQRDSSLFELKVFDPALSVSADQSGDREKADAVPR